MEVRRVSGAEEAPETSSRSERRSGAACDVPEPRLELGLHRRQHREWEEDTVPHGDRRIHTRESGYRSREVLWSRRRDRCIGVAVSDPGNTGVHPVRQRSGVRRQEGSGMVAGERLWNDLHHTWKPVGEPTGGELQRKPAGRMLEHARIRMHPGIPGDRGGVAKEVQRGETAQRSGILDAGRVRFSGSTPTTSADRGCSLRTNAHCKRSLVHLPIVLPRQAQLCSHHLRISPYHSNWYKNWGQATSASISP